MGALEGTMQKTRMSACVRSDDRLKKEAGTREEKKVGIGSETIRNVTFGPQGTCLIVRGRRRRVLVLPMPTLMQDQNQVRFRTVREYHAMVCVADTSHNTSMIVRA